MTVVVNAFAGTGLRACPWAFVHASDRLVSLLYHSGRCEPRYPLFNKMVLVRTSDAIACISFAGLAVLEDAPLDTWIASRIAGRDLTGHLGLGTGEPTGLPNLGLVVMRLEDALNGAYARQKPCEPLAICITGAFRKRRRWSRFSVTLQCLGGRERVFALRRSVWDSHEKLAAYVLALPAPLLADTDSTWACDRMSRISSLCDLQGLVDSVVTDVARRHPRVVGKDVTGVTILPYERPVVDAVYLHRSGIETFEGFTPWMIGRHTLLGPCASSGPLLLSLDDVQVRWRPIGLSSVPTGREAPVTEGLIFSFRPQVNRETW